MGLSTDCGSEPPPGSASSWNDTPMAPTDPVAPAERSPSGKAKAGSKRTEDGLVVHTLPDLLAELATLCRNQVRILPGENSFTQLTTPTELQTRAFELLNLHP